VQVKAGESAQLEQRIPDIRAEHERLLLALEQLQSPGTPTGAVDP
jgi:hypothetical protein